MRGFHERGYFFMCAREGGSVNFGGTGRRVRVRVRVRVPGPIFVFGVRVPGVGGIAFAFAFPGGEGGGRGPRTADPSLLSANAGCMVK